MLTQVRVIMNANSTHLQPNSLKQNNACEAHSVKLD